MSARADLLTEYGRADVAPLGTLTDFRLKLDAYRAEVLAEDGQAYDGELAMLRGLVRTLRAVVRDDREEVAQREVRRLLYEHAADERAAYKQMGSHQADDSSESAPEDGA
jgi:predicted DCC family thiol-disulfide oxidoreductase YuxK